MVFSSAVFLFLFLPIVFVIYYNPFFKGRGFRNVFLFLASIGFYAYGEPLFVFLMLFSVALTWWMGLHVTKPHRRIVLVLGTVFHIGVLFVFKYMTFLSGQLGLLLHKDLGVSITLPIGISFFTFQLMSYLFDVYRQKAEPQKNLLYVGLYVALFPQLIAGPIVRYSDVAYEIEHRVESREDITLGMERFIYGLAKKLILANSMAVIADNIFLTFDSVSISVLTAWLGAIAYTLQIYFDFSGYSDMAIGLGRMFGFHFLENFNYPYISASVTEFWRRWHISLSSWFRDYVYIPLGGNRCGRSRWLLNLFVVWLLTGIWHGANWTFVVWGLYYFVLLILEKLTGFDQKLGRFSHVYTLVIVTIGWIIFRSDSLSIAVGYVGAMFGIGASGLSDAIFTSYLQNGWVLLLASVIGCLPVLPFLKKRYAAAAPAKQLPAKGRKGKSVKAQAVKPSRNAGWVEAAGSVYLLVLFVVSVLAAVSSTYNPFIYFNF